MADPSNTQGGGQHLGSGLLVGSQGYNERSRPDSICLPNWKYLARITAVENNAVVVHWTGGEHSTAAAANAEARAALSKQEGAGQ